MNCGDIVLVHYPFTDVSGSKLRPAIVVSADVFNQGDDLVLVPISSVPAPDDPHAMLVEDADPVFPRTGLKRSSTIKWTKPVTLSKTILERRLGCLSEPHLSSLRTKIQSIFS